MAGTEIFAGIDVSKDHLDLSVSRSREVVRLPNSEPGISALVERLRDAAPALVVLEATGGYELAAAATLAAAEIPVVIANPRHVRDFAKATGQLAKTDAIVAQVLALFAERIRPSVRALPDEDTRDLAAIVARRRSRRHHPSQSSLERASDSGHARGKRIIWGGRASVRSALYMSIWSASQYNPVIRRFYQRLRARGKPAKVAQVACMRKLITILNAMVRDHRAWDPQIPTDQLRIQHSR